MAKVIVIDTSMLCVWLRLPGFTRCGADADPWDYDRIDAKLQAEIAADSTLVLPLATIIETGNHISQLAGDSFPHAQRFADILRSAVNNSTPWAAFSEQTGLWDDVTLLKLADDWPALAAQRVSLGDATIKSVAEFYAEARYTVEILTGDDGLKSFQPVPPTLPAPRRDRR